MKSFLAFAIVSAVPFSSLASATNTVHLGITGKHQPARVGKFQQRDNSVDVAAEESDNYVLYVAKASVGTPPQDMEFQLDTGSSDIWMIASNAITNDAKAQPGVEAGNFDESKSSTYNLTGEGKFGIRYGDGSRAIGDEFQDTFAIGGAELTAIQMGLARNTTTSPGLIGLGFRANEAAVSHGNPTYPNLVETMVNQGVIQTHAYSLWLDDLESKEGSLLFGGVDTAKYEGDLTSLALYPSSDGKLREFLVSWTSLSITSSSGVSNITAPDFPATAVLLDSGSTLALLSPAIANAIYDIMGSVDYFGVPIMPCSMKNTEATLDIGFGGPSGPVMRIPLRELVLPLYFRGDNPSRSYNSVTGSTGDPNETACQLGIQPTSGDTFIFGDSILRSMYVVYDLANSRVAIAQTKFNATDTKVVAFESLSAAIPSATSVADEVPVATPAAVSDVPVATPTETATVDETALPTAEFTGTAGAALASAYSSITALKTTSVLETTTAPGAAATSGGNSKDNKGAAMGAVRPFVGEQMFLLALMAGLMAASGLMLA